MVDNGSTDGTIEAARSLALPALRILSRGNRGFGAGCNAGLATVPVEGEYVLFLNPDAVVLPRDLLVLTEYLDANPSVALVAPRLYRHGEPIESAGRRASLFTELRPLMPGLVQRFLTAKRFPPDFAVTGPVGYVEGACLLARAAPLRRVRGFDEEYFLFFEELDLAERLRKLGYQVHLCASASAEHLRGVSRERAPFASQPIIFGSAVRYLARHRGRWMAWLFREGLRIATWMLWRTGRLEPDARKAMVDAVRGMHRRARRGVASPFA